jgi:flagellar basal body P-ring formation protein FlgA
MIRAGLASILLLMGGGAAQAALGQALTGGEISVIVHQALVANGQDGTPIIAAQRRYYPCEVALTVSPRREGRWDAVDVACPGAIPWSIVVRTSVGVPPGFRFGDGDAEAEMTNVVVLRQAIRRDEVLTEDKLELVEIARAPAPGAFSEIAPLIGRRMSQSLGAGVPLRARHLEMDWSVRADDPIVIETAAGGLVISMAGVALENGQTGDFIRVRNLRSGKVVIGAVTAEKKISVTPNMN